MWAGIKHLQTLCTHINIHAYIHICIHTDVYERVIARMYEVLKINIKKTKIIPIYFEMQKEVNWCFITEYIQMEQGKNGQCHY